MRTFEQFITEADEMGLASRVASGQVNPQQAAVIAKRRAVRDKFPNTQTSTGSTGLSQKPITGPGVVGSPGAWSSAHRAKPVDPANDPLRNALPKLSPAKTTNVLPKPEKEKLELPGKRKPIPNHLALSTKVKDPKDAQVQQQREKVLGKNSNRSDVEFRKGLGNVAKKIGSQLLKKQEAPKLGVTGGKDLGGPQVFGGATR